MIMQKWGVQLDLIEIPSAVHGFNYDILLLHDAIKPLRCPIRDIGF
jgi:hypothetical protein